MTAPVKSPPFWLFVAFCAVVYFVAVGAFLLFDSWWWLEALIAGILCLAIMGGALQFHGARSYLLLIFVLACLLIPLEAVLIIGLP